VINRVMRLNRNPDARGFVVRVLEEISRDESPEALALNAGSPLLSFKCIAKVECGTRKKADAEWARLKAEYNAR
jgi:hypothetical protein